MIRDKEPKTVLSFVGDLQAILSHFTKPTEFWTAQQSGMSYQYVEEEEEEEDKSRTAIKAFNI